MKGLFWGVTFCLTLVVCGFSLKAALPQRDTMKRERVVLPVKELRVGDKLPDFNLEDVNGQRVSLKKFKGKYVFIDVWATWCVVCLHEESFFSRLEDKFHGKRIAFVSISADKHRELWLKTVKSKKTKIPQWRFPEGEGSPFLVIFGIEAIPRFILLDKKRRIVNSKCGMPSWPETEKMLSALKGI